MKTWLLVLGSALLYLAAFPPFNLGLLVFVALVPWLLSLQHATRRQAGWGGFLWGVIVGGAQMIWIPNLVTQWTGNSSLGWLPWTICALIGGGYYAFMAHLMRRALDRNWSWAIPLIWAGFEIIRSYIPALAFPFFLIATPLWKYPYLIQSAHIGTIYLVSAWVVVINVLAYCWLNKVAYRPLRPLIMAAMVIGGVSIVRFMTPIEGKPTSIVAGQPGVDMAFGGQDAANRLFGNVAYINSEAKRLNAAALVLPEGLAQGDSKNLPKGPFEIDPKVPTLIGGQRFEISGDITKRGTAGEAKRYQSAYSCFGGKCTFNDKARLVPFGEYVPGRNFIPFLKSFKLGEVDLIPGDRTRSIKVGGIEMGPLICFEGLFWDVAHKQSENGAQVLAIMSLDDWYMGSPAPDQLRTAAVWRAVETGLPVVRAASTGYTMGVDQRGKVIDEAPLGKPVALHLRVAIEDKPAKMPQRPIFVWALGLSLPILTILLYWKRRDG